MANRRPFHETIVDVLIVLPNNICMIDFVAYLIKGTKITKNHDAIIKAWKELLKRTKRIDSSGVERDLIEQKREAAEEARKKRQAEIREIAEDARLDCN